MAKYSAADVKALRERTGSGMLDCKKALDEAEGDLDRAIEVLRVKGLKNVGKRSERTTSNGLVLTRETPDGVYVVELLAETDFVAKNAQFGDLAGKVADAVVAAKAADTAAALAAPLDGKTIGDVITAESAVIGEKLELGCVVKVTGEKFSVYLHRTNPDLPPQIAVVLGYSGDNDEVAHEIAQHIAFAAPKYLTVEEIPDEVVANERRVAEEVTRAEGKPEKIIPKIVEGRLHSFYKTIVLPEQAFARDEKQSIQQVLDGAGLTVTSFARVKVGEAATAESK
ncbi:MAG: translation elongation factor Ts [Microbacteriaceae bacterium]|jgi:elongation factor Ts|nr:translation elongation factor Ts [Microbacteriaceae bacterium]MCI1207154.1 translation elongation factor Ts [Microbacteriaceae bacterium]